MIRRAPSYLKFRNALYVKMSRNQRTGAAPAEVWENLKDISVAAFDISDKLKILAQNLPFICGGKNPSEKTVKRVKQFLESMWYTSMVDNAHEIEKLTMAVSKGLGSKPR